MSGQESEQTSLLREILKWIRFAGMKEVKAALSTALDTDQKKLVYQLSDGKASSSEIAKVGGVSDWTVRNWWKIWAKTGIVEPLKAGRGERYMRSFDLEDFGIDVSKISTPEVKREEVQETLPVQDESGKIGGITDE